MSNSRGNRPVPLGFLNVISGCGLERRLARFFLDHRDLSIDIILIDITVVSDPLLLDPQVEWQFIDVLLLRYLDHFPLNFLLDHLVAHLSLGH